MKLFKAARLGAKLFWTGLALALFSLSPLLPLLQNPETVLAAPTALQPYGRCAPPSQEGVTICMPYAGAGVRSPFQLIAAGTSGRGRVNNMQLWADGAKLMQTAGSPFDQAVSLPPGDHELTLIEVDETGFSATAQMKVTVVDRGLDPSCSAPSTPGVHICLPDSPCNPDPWLDVSAAGLGETGPVVRMEMWLNGAKVANFQGGHFNTHPIFFDAFYTLEIWEVDSHGHALKADLKQDGPC